MKLRKIIFGLVFGILTFLSVGIIGADASEYEENLIKKIAPDGKNAVLKMVKPENPQSAEFTLSAVVNNMLNEENYLAYAYVNPDNTDMSDCIVVICNNNWEEIKKYNIKVTYDEPKRNSVVENFISNLKNFNREKDDYYHVSDLNLINYYLTSAKSELWNEKAAQRAMKYSNDIIKLTKGGNVSFVYEVGGGNEDPSCMYESAFGEMTVFYNGYAYVTKQQGLYLTRVIYIPQDTEDTKEAYAKAAQKRIDEYIGNNDVKVTYGGTLNSLTDDQLDEFVDSNATDGNYYNITVKGKTYRFYIIKGTKEELDKPSYLGSDLDNGISITSEQAEVPLDTSVKAESVENEKIEKTLGTKEYVAYDIKLHSEAKEASIEQLKNGMFKVSIPLNKKLDSKLVKVYYIDGDNNKKSCDYQIINDTVVFETNHFSVYAIAEEDASSMGNATQETSDDKESDSNVSKLDDTPKTGDNKVINTYIVLLIVSMLMVTVLRKKYIK